MRKLAVMQPYFMPYVGYFQLINAADCFVLFDDVAYIKKGWINRNRICVAGRPYTFTVPLVSASQNRAINKHSLFEDGRWRYKLLATIETSYRNAINFDDAFPLVASIVLHPVLSLSEFITHSLKRLCSYLQISTQLVSSSCIYNNQELRAQDRIIDICKKEQADVYINPINGQDLYQDQAFRAEGIELLFLQSRVMSYMQALPEFCPSLSIIDVLMNNSQTEARELLSQYQLVRNL